MSAGWERAVVGFDAIVVLLESFKMVGNNVVVGVRKVSVSRAYYVFDYTLLGQ